MLDKATKDLLAKTAAATAQTAALSRELNKFRGQVADAKARTKK